MPTGSISLRFIRLGGICLLLCACVLNSPLSAAESTLENAKNLMGILEAAEAGHDAGVSQETLMERLEQTGKALASHLQVNPSDVDALIISARLDRFRLMMEPIIFSKGDEPPDISGRYAPIHEKLDRALALQPNNAEAHYWKARLYGVRHPVIRQDRFYMEIADIDQAIKHARRAVELEPANVVYREALALYLIQADKSSEALEVIRPVANGQHPIYLLLNDLEALPIPTSAVLSAGDTENFAQMEMERGRIHDYPLLRVHVYVVPMTVAKLQEFYAGYWNGFEFYPPPDLEGMGNGEMRAFQQLFERKGDKLQPARAASEIPQEPSSGILLSGFEESRESLIRHLEAHGGNTAALKLSAGEADRFCFFFVVNTRRFD
jgi:tetratricopeptide (TPR) repeat protein